MPGLLPDSSDSSRQRRAFAHACHNSRARVAGPGAGAPPGRAADVRGDTDSQNLGGATPDPVLPAVRVVRAAQQVWRLDGRYDRLPPTALIPETGQYQVKEIFSAGQ
jgi:hypothetical protein